MKAAYEIEEAPPVHETRVLRVGGELDSTNAADFEAAVGALSASGVVLDLNGALYCDSAGFAALDRLLVGRPVALALSPEHPVHKAAEIMGLPLHDTVADASLALGR